MDRWRQNARGIYVNIPGHRINFNFLNGENIKNRYPNEDVAKYPFLRDLSFRPNFWRNLVYNKNATGDNPPSYFKYPNANYYIKELKPARTSIKTFKERLNKYMLLRAYLTAQATKQADINALLGRYDTNINQIKRNMHIKHVSGSTRNSIAGPSVPLVIQTNTPSRNTNTGRKNSKKRTIWRGPKGGLYVLVNGRKTYKFTEVI